MIYLAQGNIKEYKQLQHTHKHNLIKLNRGYFQISAKCAIRDPFFS